MFPLRSRETGAVAAAFALTASSHAPALPATHHVIVAWGTTNSDEPITFSLHATDVPGEGGSAKVRRTSDTVDTAITLDCVIVEASQADVDRRATYASGHDAAGKVYTFVVLNMDVAPWRNFLAGLGFRQDGTTRCGATGGLYTLSGPSMVLIAP